MLKKSFANTLITKTLEFVKDIFYPKDLMIDQDTFTKEQIKTLSDRKTISKLLFYRSYFETEDGYGFYVQADGKIGIVFRIYPPAYLLAETEKTIINLLNSILIDGAVINFVTFASKNVHPVVDYFVNIHSAKPNVKYPEVLDDFVDEMDTYYRRWTHESVAGKDADLRLRRFIHTFSILFPYDTDEYVIKQQYNQILGILSDFSARLMKPNEFVPFIREILNPSLDKYPESNDPITTLNKQMTKEARISLNEKDSSLEFANGWKAKVLSTDKYPNEIDIFTYQNLFFDVFGNDFQVNLPCPFLLSLTVRFRNIEKQKKQVLSKARWNLGQLSGMPPMVYKKRPLLKERRDENEEVIAYIEKLGEIPLDAMWSLTVFEENEKKLEQYIAMIKKSFSETNGQWILKEEKFPQIAYQTFLMSLPLQYSEIIHENIDKFDKNFKSNNAQITPLIGDFQGNGEPHLLYFGRTGQIMSVDIFNSDNYNVIVIGPMGSGKSFWTNDFLAKSLAAGWQIRLIDFGRSYKKFSEIVGGQFTEFTDRTKVCMNFFTDIVTKLVIDEKGVEHLEIADEELEMLIPIVGNMASLNLNDIYRSSGDGNDKLEMTVVARFIAKAIKRAFEVKGFEAGMKQVREALIEFRDDLLEKESIDIATLLEKIIIALEPYAIEGGEYYYIFNGANNVNFENNYFILELEELSRSAAKPVVAMAFLQKAAQEAFIGYEKDKSTKRIVGVDEAWKVISDPLFAQFLEDFARRIRKYNGVTLIITQTVDEFFQNPQAEVIYKTSDWKIFLPHSKDQIEQSISTGKISLNKFDIQLFKSLKSRYPHYSEFFVKHKRREFVALLKASPYLYWLYTTNPKDRATLENVQKQYNLTLQQAVWFMAKKWEGMEEEEILYRISEQNKDNDEINWELMFKEVIENESIILRQEAIIDIVNSNIEFVEYLPTLQYKNRDFRPGDFLFKAKELGYLLDIKSIFFRKVFNDNISYIKSINIGIDGIKSQKFKDYVFSLLEKNNNILFEIKLSYKKEELDEILKFSNYIKKEYKAKIIFDNIKFDKIDFSSLLEYKPSYLKIPIDEIKKRNKEDVKKIFDLLQEALKIKVVITFIENQEDLELVKLIGVNLLQGYYINNLLSQEGVN